MFEKFTIKQLNIYKKNKNGKNAINILMLNRDKDFFNKIFEKLNYTDYLLLNYLK